MENIDITPTLLSLCNLPPLETTDGHDLTPLLKGKEKPLREVAVTENVWSKALRWGPWRFVHYPRALFGSDVGELYNLENDPNETQNLYHDPASAGDGGGVPNASTGVADRVHTVCHGFARTHRASAVPHRPPRARRQGE